MGDPTSTETTVLHILAEVLDESVDVLSKRRVLAAHEWDSMTSLVTLAELESRFGVTIDLRSYHAARTVDDLVALVAPPASTNRIGEKCLSRPGMRPGSRPDADIGVHLDKEHR